MPSLPPPPSKPPPPPPRVTHLSAVEEADDPPAMLTCGVCGAQYDPADADAIVAHLHEEPARPPIAVIKGENRSPPIPPVAAAHPELYAPGGARAGQDAGLTREEVARMYGALEDRLHLLFEANAIDKAEHARRLRAVRRAARSPALAKCRCGAIIGAGPYNCTACGDALDASAAAMWKLRAGAYRRLFAELATDILRVDGIAKGAPGTIHAPAPHVPERARAVIAEIFGVDEGEIPDVDGGAPPRDGGAEPPRRLSAKERAARRWGRRQLE